jgi:hypothetical protein
MTYATQTMRRLARLLVVVTVLSACLVTTSVRPARANTAIATLVQGTGTLDPGLGAPGGSHNYWTFTSVLVTVAGVVADTPNVSSTSQCGAYGETTSNGLAYSTGVGWWSCSSGVLAGRVAFVTLVRVGVVQVLVLTEGYLTGPLVCLFEPHQTPPQAITSYSLVCGGAAQSQW